MAVFTPSYPLTFPTVSGVRTQKFSLVRTVAVSSSPFTGQDQVVQHEGEFWTTQITFPPMLKLPSLDVTLSVCPFIWIPICQRLF